jgi:farnesyl diphosphate synthase
MLVQSARGALLSSRESYMGTTCTYGATFVLQKDLGVGRPHGRRFQPAGCAAKQVGLVACNDYIILESCIYRILKKHFGQKPYYGLLLDVFHEVAPLLPLPPSFYLLYHLSTNS